MRESDLPAADGLRRLIGWNQTPEKWRRLFDFEPEGCFVAVQDTTVIGTVTTITYSQALSWIGMMLVHPEYRRQGIARRLMSRALEHLKDRGVRTVRLDATPAGAPVYEKLGFVPEWALTRWQRPAQVQAEVGQASMEDARRLEEADWPAVDALDTAAFGATRLRLIRSLVHGGRSAAVWPARGEVLGWGALQPGAEADYLGPMASANSACLRPLARALLPHAGNRPIFWDIPDFNEPARIMAESLGFTAVRLLTRMRLGPDLARGNPQAQFGIADPAVG
jgi:predicted N-acetyltransferase YhbS